jgi:hypothetical protein
MKNQSVIQLDSKSCLSSNHPILVKDKNGRYTWREVGKLKATDKVESVREIVDPDDIEFCKEFSTWWKTKGSKLPFTPKCIAYAAYRFGRDEILNKLSKSKENNSKKEC